MSGVEPNWPVVMFITLHIGRNRSQLHNILGALSPVPVSIARHGERFDRGIYLAPSDRHLIISNGTILLSDGPKENYARPAIDPMFRSAADQYGSRVIGILLTGHLYDGMTGLVAVQEAGGCTIVQDPSDAEVPEIPRNAIGRLKPTFVLPLLEIPNAIVRCIEMEDARGSGRHATKA